MGIYDYAYIALWISFFLPTASKLICNVSKSSHDMQKTAGNSFSKFV